MQTWQAVATAAGATTATFGLLAGGAAYASRWPTSQIFGNTLIEVPDPDSAHPTVALTYDDGPSPRNTEPLLDLFARHNVHATFFLIGNHVRKHPHIARQVAAAGHTIGNHTEMHPDLARKDEARIRAELEHTQAILQDTLGLTPTLFRPPYGSRRPATLRIARALGLTPVLWNVTANDWKPLGPDRLLRRIQTGIERNRKRARTSNVLLHDASHLDGAQLHSRADTLAVTAALLEQSNLRFTTVDRWL